MRVTRSTVFMSALGGVLNVIDQFGEVVGTIPVQPGRTRALSILPFVPDGCTLEPASGDVQAVTPAPRIAVIRTEGHTESAANPDWEPSSAERMQREMRELLQWKRQTQAAKAKRARLKAALAIEAMPEAHQTPEAAQEAAVVEQEANAVVGDEPQVS